MTRLLSGTAIVSAAFVGLLSFGGPDRGHLTFSALLMTLWLSYVASAFWVTRSGAPLRRPVLTVALLALVVQIPGIFTPPRTSSDAYRYVWDGRVSLSGTSPYRFVPLDDHLAGLRDPILFPGLRTDQRSGVKTVPLPTDAQGILHRAQADSRTLINRPSVPTIYPPLAQLWFAAVAALTPWSLGTLGLQIASALIAVAVAAALAAWLQRRGRNPREALWWAWCPTVILEVGNAAHVDVLVAPLVLGAVVVMATRPGRTMSSWLAGVLLGAAAAVKLTPLVLLPAFMPLSRGGVRRTWQAPAAALATLLASYAPHVLIAGALVIGYLPGYLSEEGGGNRGGLLRLVVPDGALTAAMLLTMTAVAIWVVRRSRVEQPEPERAALVLFGSLLLVTTPSYPWYCLPLVVLAVLARRLEWLAVAVAGYIAYAGSSTSPLRTSGYAVAAMVVVGVGIWRRHPPATSPGG